MKLLLGKKYATVFQFGHQHLGKVHLTGVGRAIKKWDPRGVASLFAMHCILMLNGILSFIVQCF